MKLNTSETQIKRIHDSELKYMDEYDINNRMIYIENFPINFGYEELKELF